MLDPLPILPFTSPAAASVRLPGSKSITNRALLLAALCRGETVLEGALFSEDTEIMIAALRDLGFSIKANPAAETIHIQGEGGRIPNPTANLFVGNAGTAARFLTALCCLASGGVFELDGVPAMRKRPMKGLIEALAALGARIESNDGHFPLRIHANGLSGGRVEVDAAASSQMLSALLMVAPFAKKGCTFSVNQGPRQSLPFVEMTLRMMEQFGQKGIDAGESSEGLKEITIAAGNSYQRSGVAPYLIEADVTAASYFATLPLVTGGWITIDNLLHTHDGLQGDAAYFRILKKLGGRMTAEDSGGIRFDYPALPEQTSLDEDFSTFSDTFLTLSAVSPLLKTTVRIRGIAHTRKQETDRIAGMAHELRKLGQQVKEEEDALEVTPSRMALEQSKTYLIETYKDHRFAMSFTLLGLFNLHGDARPWIEIHNPECCAKTYPGFFRVLESVRKQSHETGRG